MSTGGSTRLSYVPTPHERAYYEALFNAADSQRAGSIGGAEAVRFFSSSKLPVDALKSVWTLADQPPTNTLDRPKFAVAIRLIQLLQNGQKGQGPNLAAAEGVSLRPVMFEGISGVSVPLPAPEGSGHQQPPQQQPYPQQQGVAMTPPRAGPPAPNAPPSTALAPQDPYILTAAEQSRYEALFPEYAKEGFVYGTEAVSLFSKSGLQPPQLAAIWNMVDQPVDNRLDSLEFCIAMHLIVCVSKKNLPLPPSLPPSLQQVKAQPKTQAPMPQPPPSPGQGVPIAPGSPQGQIRSTMSTSAVGFSSPSMQSSSAQQYSMPQPAAAALSRLPGPPPLTQQSALSISDAFEGLNTGPAGPTAGVTSFMNQAPPSPRAPTPPPVPTAVLTMGGSLDMASSHSVSQRPLSPLLEQPPTKAKLYDASDSSSEELVKLKALMQKLQAENISLKASLKGMSEEELGLQGELRATVAEIATLNNELTTLRAKVLAAKSRLLEATSELKANREKKTILTDLISEASATKEALDDAYASIENANETARARPASAAYEGDLFGFSSPAPAASLPAPAAVPELDEPEQFSSAPSYDEVDQNVRPRAGYQYEPPENNGFFEARVPDTTTPGYMEGEGIMGGGPTPLPSESTTYGVPSGGQAYGGSGSSMERVESLKRQLKEAEDIARDAEASSKQLNAAASELRRLADEAEVKARQFASQQAEPKKKGFLRGSKKKLQIDAKEGEKLAQDAKTKKDKLMDIQSQVNDSNKVAAETKREVERLRREVEQAELDAASAASMQHVQPANGYPTRATDTADYGMGSPMGGGPMGGASSYGLSPSKPPASNPYPAYGMNVPSGIPSYGIPEPSGYNRNVMGGGGLSIPEPIGNVDDPYSNPFE